MLSKDELKNIFIQSLKIPEDISVSEWCEKNIFLSSESASEKGPYRINRTPYIKDILDQYANPNIRQITLKASAQVGKSTILNNLIAYTIKEKPSAIIFAHPSLDIASTYSRTRIEPLFRDSQNLKNTFIDESKSKVSGDTILYKKFNGGFLKMVGSNSEASLSGIPSGNIFGDEVSLWENQSALELLKKRTTTFFNSKIILASTPTIEGYCRISQEYENSSKGKYYVPCPHCKSQQILLFKGVIFERDKAKKKVLEANYRCKKCKKLIPEFKKIWMLRNGVWVHENRDSHHLGYWLNECYSPFVSWQMMAQNFIESTGIREKLKRFTNLSLGETFKEDIGRDNVRFEHFKDKLFDYDKLPLAVRVLTAGVDVQDDRIEGEIVGYGENGESWGVDYFTIIGKPALAVVWEELAEKLLKKWPREDGVQMGLYGACIDSGYHTQEVYRFCQKHERRRWLAVKGASKSLDSFFKKSTSKIQGCSLYSLDTFRIKKVIYGNMKAEVGEHGFMAFPKKECYDKNYFKMLTAEFLDKKIDNKGNEKLQFIKKKGARNEAFDCRVYSYALLAITNVDLTKTRNPNYNQHQTGGFRYRPGKF